MSGIIVPVGWQSVEECLPNNARVVLATDLENHYLAIYADDVWASAETDEELDCYMTHWQELPELPEDWS
jgi:hypothetical protein